MTSPVKPEELNFDAIRNEEAKFHEYLARLPTLGEFEERKMNVVEGEKPQEEPGEWRKEEN